MAKSGGEALTSLIDFVKNVDWDDVVAPAADQASIEGKDQAALVLCRDKFSQLLAVPSVTKARNPRVPCLGVHYFSVDGVRITQVNGVDPAFDQKYFSVHFTPHLWTRVQAQWNRTHAFIMLAYRQLFQESHTLNAWLLRAGNDPTHFAIAEDGTSSADVIVVSPTLAAAIIHQQLLDQVGEFVGDALPERPGNSVAEGFAAAEQLYRTIHDQQGTETKRPEWYPRDQKDIVTSDPNLEAPLKAVLDDICGRLRLPTSRRGANYSDNAELAAFRMLQSALFYLRIYSAKYFYTFTSDLLSAGGEEKSRSQLLHDPSPFGLTLLLDEDLCNDERAAIGDCVQSAKNAIDRVLGRKSGSATFEREPPEFCQWDTELSDVAKKSYFWKTKRGFQLLDEVARRQCVPMVSLSALINSVEKATDLEIEQESPQVAFVLSQRSYLESVGSVSVLLDHFADTKQTYLSLVSDKAERIGSRHEDRWRVDAIHQPFDVVYPLGDRGADAVESLDQYLGDKWNYPCPAEGFHLLDLDPRLHAAEPRMGASILRLGTVGFFQEGGLVAGGIGIQRYIDLSVEVPRFVAGVTTGTGEAYLIYDGGVQAVFKDREWRFYRHAATTNSLIGTINQGTPEGERLSVQCKLATRVLELSRTLSHTLRKGGMFVVTDYNDATAWNEDKSSCFVEMVSCVSYQNHLNIVNHATNHQRKRDEDRILALAQMDGSCAITLDGAIVGWGLKIGISLNDIVSSGGGATSTAASVNEELRKDIGRPGTRRWSAAMLSRKKPGWIILTISKDGPVTLYHRGALKKICPEPSDEQGEAQAQT